MGNHSEFEGRLFFDQPLHGELVEFVNNLAAGRRMARDVNYIIREAGKTPPYWTPDGTWGEEGEYYNLDEGFSDYLDDPAVLDTNRPPITQPGLYLGVEIQWNERMRFDPSGWRTICAGVWERADGKRLRSDDAVPHPHGKCGYSFDGIGFVADGCDPAKRIVDEQYHFPDADKYLPDCYLRWDGCSVFYGHLFFTDWLKYLIRKVFAPHGIKINGRIKCECCGKAWTIIATDNNVIVTRDFTFDEYRFDVPEYSEMSVCELAACELAACFQSGYMYLTVSDSEKKPGSEYEEGYTIQDALLYDAAYRKYVPIVMNHFSRFFPRAVSAETVVLDFFQESDTGTMMLVFRDQSDGTVYEIEAAAIAPLEAKAEKTMSKHEMIFYDVVEENLKDIYEIRHARTDFAEAVERAEKICLASLDHYGKEKSDLTENNPGIGNYYLKEGFHIHIEKRVLTNPWKEITGCCN